MYLANILVAGWISVSSLFFPKIAETAVFTNDFTYSESIRLVGALWMGIAILSVIGMFYPLKMSPVLLMQLIYKLLWILASAIPAMVNQQPYPKAMAAFFITWILILPFVIPWKELFS